MHITNKLVLADTTANLINNGVFEFLNAGHTRMSIFGGITSTYTVNFDPHKIDDKLSAIEDHHGDLGTMDWAITCTLNDILVDIDGHTKHVKSMRGDYRKIIQYNQRAVRVFRKQTLVNVNIFKGVDEFTNVDVGDSGEYGLYHHTNKVMLVYTKDIKIIKHLKNKTIGKEYTSKVCSAYLPKEADSVFRKYIVGIEDNQVVAIYQMGIKKEVRIY